MPSHHSRSSHSSSSRSSSSRSSSRSSSHSYSSHSSSSYSSSSRSSSSGSRSSSRHASSSRSSAPSYRSSSPYVQGGLPAGRIIKRARTRQPEGYTASSSSSRRTTSHYCVHHNYVYYPTSWTDSRTGTHYQSGYYDENGQFYEDVAFKRNGRYYNVLCACDYCGTQVKKDLSGEGDQTLVCQQCGAPLRIVSALDEYTQDPDYTRAMESSGKKPGRGCLWGFLIALAVFVCFCIIAAQQPGTPSPAPPVQTEEVFQLDGPGSVVLSNVDLFGETIYLQRVDDNCYRISEQGEANCDKRIVWLSDEESYYDTENDCYFWFNTDVEPAIWQYWAEGISSDFGDYGWMEYEAPHWYVETDDGWIPLPAKYDTSHLWHFENANG